ncbi:MAG TPA: PspC domain-containing protein [Saprospiraceae bacterium]|nr:PspC domain-containing protein [Saprospiraceae bacterium]
MFPQNMIEYLRAVIEKSAFGVCQAIGDRLGIQASKIRLYFIYTSFITMGSPLVIYLIIAFWMNVRKYFRNPGKLLWD